MEYTIMAPTIVYRSKIDWWMRAILFGFIPGISVFIPVYELYMGDWTAVMFGLGFLVLYLILLLCLIFPMKYIITENALIIRHGLVRHTISLREIREVRPSKNPLSSPALSLDRLQIDRVTGFPVLISPENKDSFIIDLASRCIHLKQDGSCLIRQEDG